MFFSPWPFTHINKVDACCYQHTSTIKFVNNATRLMWRFTDALRFGVTVCRYKRSPTLGVINLLHGRNLLTTLDTPLSSSQLFIVLLVPKFKGVTWPVRRLFPGYIVMHGLVLANVYQRTKCEACTLYRCWVNWRWINRDLEIWVRDHSRSLEMVPFDRLGTLSYSHTHSIVTWQSWLTWLTTNGL